jgi:hypothetical protein
LPFRGHVDEALINQLRRFERGIEVLQAANANPVHPLKIQSDAFLGNVAVHPVPPDARSCRRWRILKADS